MDSIAQAVTTSCHDDDLARAKSVGAHVEAWASVNLREFPWRHWSDVYRLTVTEILLQQTSAAKVSAMVEAWFDRYRDWPSLAAAPVRDLETDLRPLGLHRRRADVLHRLAVSFVTTPEFPMESRPGVGQYVSRAVRVATDDGSEAMVDVNFVRILQRAFGGAWRSDYRYDTRLQSLAQAVVDGAQDPKAVNWGVLDLAALVCKAGRPKCTECPIMSLCSVGRTAGVTP